MDALVVVWCAAVVWMKEMAKVFGDRAFGAKRFRLDGAMWKEEKVAVPQCPHSAQQHQQRRKVMKVWDGSSSSSSAPPPYVEFLDQERQHQKQQPPSSAPPPSPVEFLMGVGEDQERQHQKQLEQEVWEASSSSSSSTAQPLSTWEGLLLPSATAPDLSRKPFELVISVDGDKWSLAMMLPDKGVSCSCLCPGNPMVLMASGVVHDVGGMYRVSVSMMDRLKQLKRECGLGCYSCPLKGLGAVAGVGDLCSPSSCALTWEHLWLVDNTMWLAVPESLKQWVSVTGMFCGL